MEDYLKTLCTALGINLVYTRNKHTILSSSLVRGVPTLRVNVFLEHCGSSVASSIISYYTEESDLEAYFTEITAYLINLYPNFKFRIKAPDIYFRAALKSTKADDLPEVEIQSMIIKGFSNNNADNALILQDDDILELDIFINPSNT